MKPPALLRRLRVLALATLAVVTMVVAGAFAAGLRYLHAPVANPLPQATVEVPPGSSLARVANQLHNMGWLRYPAAFSLLARWQGVAGDIKSGEYALEADLTPAALLERMVAGDTLQYRLTLIEGWTFTEAVLTIQDSTGVVSTLDALEPAQLARALGLEHGNPEGMLFPDTYFYPRGTTDLQLLQRAHARLEEILQTEWESRSADLPYEDAYHALVMASMVEKEAGRSSERGHIAGVFVRRLQQGMRLQSDPTVIYGMGKDFSGDLRRQDLMAESEYNTYRINGLPPTPIALAGLESIRASLHPTPSDYLYFVSRGDGSHQFSVSLEEHNAAVNRYQRGQVPQQGQGRQ